MLYVCNYADAKYKSQQELNTSTAYEFGRADKVIEFHEEDILELKEAFPEHFKIGRGGGLWLWKPYLIDKALEKLQDGDYLFYSDSGVIFIDDIHKLLPDLEESNDDIMFFELPLLSRCFSKAECYHLMDWKDYSGNQIMATYLLIKKSDRSIAFIQEWFENMKDIRKVSGDKYLPEVAEFKDFISHREDQSVLDILCKKKGIEAHRDASDFGIFPWQYMRAGGYHRKKYPNSHYPVILLCVRKNNPESYRLSYEKALRRYKQGLNNEFTARIKLFPMHCRHWGRLFARRIGVEFVLNKILGKDGKR